MWKCAVVSVGAALFVSNALGGASQAGSEQFILFNLSRGVRAEAFTQLRREFPAAPGKRVRVGLGAIFSYLNEPLDRVAADLHRFLRLARTTDTPVVVQLDGENWWRARPDLWNWWDPHRPGYSPSNRFNVEWTGWSPNDAIKIAWRNWGRQIRVLPPPNLMSPRYRAACHHAMRRLIPLVLDWWRALPPDRKDLFVGIKVGWESSIGVNAWYYPNGNALLDRPPKDDPTSGLNPEALPARGVAQIGYAAVSTAGIRRSGQITAGDLAEVVRRHLTDLCQLASRLGVPRSHLFTHGGGWKEGGKLYQAALNRYSCPGWSFYRHAANPEADPGVEAALKRSRAPYWAAAEWLYQGPRQTEPWRRALVATLAVPRCRYLCIYNWEGVRTSPAILAAVRAVAQEPAQSKGKGHEGD